MYGVARPTSASAAESMACVSVVTQSVFFLVNGLLFYAEFGRLNKGTVCTV